MLAFCVVKAKPTVNICRIIIATKDKFMLKAI